MITTMAQIDRVPPDIVARYSKLSAATVHEASGGKGALSSRIKPISPDMKVVGPAVTVKARPGDNLALHAAIYAALPGDVIVADADGYPEAGAWGDVMAVAARQRGLGGLIFNGSVRDAQAICDVGFPVFAIGLSIKGTTKAISGWINRPLLLDHTLIMPGDLVLGDRDGVVVVGRGEAEQVLEQSIGRDKREEVIKARLREGESTLDIYGLRKNLAVLGL